MQVFCESMDDMVVFHEVCEQDIQLLRSVPEDVNIKNMNSFLKWYEHICDEVDEKKKLEVMIRTWLRVSMLYERYSPIQDVRDQNPQN